MVEPALGCWQAFSRSERATRLAFVDVGPITRWWGNPDEFELELAMLQYSVGSAANTAAYSARYSSRGWVAARAESDGAAEQGVEADEVEHN